MLKSLCDVAAALSFVFVTANATDPVVWLTDKPAARLQRELAQDVEYDSLDPNLEPFFTRRSINGGRLVRRRYLELRPVYEAATHELGPVAGREIARRLNLSGHTEVRERVPTEEDCGFEFIYRAKYRA